MNTNTNPTTIHISQAQNEALYARLTPFQREAFEEHLRDEIAFTENEITINSLIQLFRDRAEEEFGSPLVREFAAIVTALEAVR